MTVFIYALLHGIPIILARYYFGSRLLLFIVAAGMAYFAKETGDPKYFLVDLIAIGLIYWVCNSSIRKSTPTQASNPTTSSTPKVEADSSVGILIFGAIVVGGYFLFKSETPSNSATSSISASNPQPTKPISESAVSAKESSKKAGGSQSSSAQKKEAPVSSDTLTNTHDEGMTKWIKVYGDEKFTGYVGHISKNQDGNTVTMWELNDLKTFTGIKGSSIQYISSKAQYEYDCEKELSRRISFSYHSGSMGSGETVHANSELGEWSPVALGTRDRNFWRYACKKS